MFSTSLRSTMCGYVDLEFLGKEINLVGWIKRVRDHGNIVFIDLGDRSGIVQVFTDRKELMPLVKGLRSEDVVQIKGVVKKRPDNMVNSDMKTGEIEIDLKEVKIMNRSEVLPFVLDDDIKVGEELRLKYRYLDLRRGCMNETIILRSEIIITIRNFLFEEGFVEIETPIMSKSTPEGARDYLVPSRINKGKFYALVQSPQIYKQLLMVAGFDRYFQIARCFRDEDQRADRQPEFTQLDIEMSFVERDDILSLVENLMRRIFKEIFKTELPIPFKRLTYDEVLEMYGSDKPDLRFDLKIKDYSEIVKKTDFKVFNDSEYTGGILFENELTRKEIDVLNDFIKSTGGSGITYLKLEGSTMSGPVAKYFKENLFNVTKGIILFISGKKKRTLEYLGMLRKKLASMKKLYDENEFNFLWVVDFPLFEYDEEEKRYVTCHHMFTMPKKEHLDIISKEPLKAKADTYDLVCNGVELASGSIRIHDRNIQKEIMKIIGMSESELEEKFGFLLEAFKYGAPPHGGIAPGIDRLVSLLLKKENIRDVIAFPKTLNGIGLMENTPDYVSEKQLKELGIKVVDDEKN
ncbi:MAG: Aspartate--tRNA ligase [candidate division TA06 bacterium 32_111]|uniref:Aspartate--tRNA(Asp/Asn) ligase n=2 Tax=Bacteria candidate phyla TaxID=1783234 RepID=A0A124G0G7_UNCT6|nr:MAG: Aspartate--tRNA ligase [candidate division TA06 bacterium 32_111]KUK87460.1 MAG: Aspartate--tRNA ligase [candidate division TA06 bacterium 34_109]HAF08203.1 aspartate--tRNA ligase [candidate division WOR-3 bacterium]HCP16765.1 aspartate--tRNA ligase [candidate division WOR-3 bacterium]